MQIHYGFEGLPVGGLRNTAVAVGSFDGLHCGHRWLIDRLAETARQWADSDGAVVVTFDPHPRQLLKGENRLLTTLPEKLMLLAETPVDHVVVVHFTPEFSRISSTTFTQEYLKARLGAATVLSGEGHHYGHNRAGTAQGLEAQGVRTDYTGRHQNISSTVIREAIQRGDMALAADLLGGPYLILTAPPHDSSKLLPPAGEYTVLVDDDPRSCRLFVDAQLFGGATRKIRIIG